MTSSSITMDPNRPSATKATMRRKARRGTTLKAAACVLAATSSSSTAPVVEAFGQRRPAALPPISLPQQQPARAAARISATSTVKSHRRTTSLGYREGNDDQSAAQRLQHRRAISPPTPSTTPTSTTSRQIPAQDVPPKLSESQKRPTGGGGGGGLLGLLSRGRRRITARNHHTEAEQFVLDEYLEFLDKRYRRMHGAEPEELAQKAKAGGNKKTLGPASRKSAGPPTNSNGSSRRNREGISTTMDWLNADDPNAASANGGDFCGCDAACQEQKRLDALEVLGLAGLASAELLRKHQLPVPEDEMVAPIAAASSTSSSSSRTTSSGIMSARNGSTSASIIDVRPTTRKHPQPTVQHRLTYVTTVTALAVRSIVTKTVTSTALYTRTIVATLPNRVGHAAGGRGRHTVRMATALVLAALCAVVRPLGLLALKVGGQN
mmetsp:Transcript_19475/g.56023  ORF Transcript_19475/g.56023 Transcript_19475/m.56023 type:complete len:436 (+) Transcript_19475:74-1381(+)